MKHPFRNIRWRRLLFRLFKGTIRVAVAVAGTLLLGAVLFDLYCEVKGLPDWALEMVRGELARQGVHGEFREVRAGFLSAINVEDATLGVTHQGVEFRLQADRIRARLGYRALISRQPFLQTIDISGASLRCESRDRTALLPYVGDLRASLRPHAGGAYAITLRGLFEGVDLRIEGLVRNAEALWRSRPEPVEPTFDLGEWLETVTRTLRDCRFGSGDATVGATVDVNADDWGEYAVMGNWNISGLMLHGNLTQSCKGQFTASPRQIVFRDVAVRLNRDEHILGKVVLEPQSRRFWAEAEGRSTLGTAFHMAGRDYPEWVRRFGLTVPLGFKAVLHPAPWDQPGQWHVELACETNGFTLRDLPVRRFRAQAELRDRVVRIPTFVWDIAGERTGEIIEGSATVWTAENQFALALDGALDWRLRSRQLGIPLPAPLRHLDTGAAPPRIRLTLDRSPYAWQEWRGTAAVRSGQLDYGTFRGGAAQADVHFGSETLRVEDIRIAVGTPGTSLAGRLDVRFPTADSPRLQLDYDVAARQTGGIGPSDLAILAGSVFWETAAETVAVRGEGTLRPDLARRALGLPDNERLNRLQCAGPPLRVRFTMPETRDHLRHWRINADVAGEEVIYDGLRFREAATSLSVAPDGISLRNLRGRTAADETFQLNLAVAFEPLAVTVTDGELHGDPLLVATFIEDREARQSYRRIWEGLDWDRDHKPQFRVPSLVYRQHNRDWRFEMRGTGEVRNVVFQGLHANRLQLAAHIELPGAVKVSEVVLATEDAVIEGEVTVTTEAIPSCDFRFTTTEGGCDPRMVLRMIDPDIEEYLGGMEFSPDSAVTAAGSFLLAKDPRLNLNGTLHTPRWQWGRVGLKDVAARWGIRDGEILWDIERAGFCGGHIVSTGVYDAVTRIGTLAVELNGASLNQLIATVAEDAETSPEHEAKVAFSGRARFLQDWAGRPVQLTGGGRLDVTEADLWRVPILSQLGALLDLPLLHRISRGGTVGLGKISALRADVVFDGERVAVPSLVTDGTVLSLSGTGEYSWRTDWLEFDIAGEAFRQAGGLVSLVTSPISWVFNARLSGTSKDYRWRMNNALRRAILGEEDSERRRPGNP